MLNSGVCLTPNPNTPHSKLTPGLVSYSASDGVGALKGSTKSGLLGLGWPSTAVAGDDKRSWWETSVGGTAWEAPECGIHLARELDHSRRDFEVPGGSLTIG